MQVFFVRAEPVSGVGPPATAFVVANDIDEALLLLRKDYNFSGYALPPADIQPSAASRTEVRQALGDAADREKGVYAFTVQGKVADPMAPPRAV